MSTPAPAAMSGDELKPLPLYDTPPKDVQEHARRAIAMLEGREKCTGWYARDAYQRDVSPSDPTACRVCLLGAVMRAGAWLQISATSLMDRVYGLGVGGAGYHDKPTTTVQDSIALLKRAANLEAEHNGQ